MTTPTARLGATAALSAALLILAGADDATQPIKAGELTFKVPASWKAEPPRSAMRKAQLKVKPVEGDADPAELLVFQFPNGAGTVEANVERWEKMFVDADGKAPKAKVEKKKGANVDVTRVEVAGRYVAAVTPGAVEKNDKPDFRLIGAIVETADSAYFFRMVGPAKTVKSAQDGFDAMIATITKG